MNKMMGDLSTPWQWQDFPDGDTQLLNSEGVSMIEGAVVLEYQEDCDALKRLIIAAPELLGLCIGILECLDQGDLWNKSARKHSADLLRKTIAKAHGE